MPMSLHPGLGLEIAFLGVVFVLSMAEGSILARHFRVLALLPFVCLNAAIVAFLWAASRNGDLALLCEAVLVSAVAPQLGYLANQIRARRINLEYRAS
jgi:hypothetical protein